MRPVRGSSSSQAIGLSRQYHAPLRYSAASQSSWFTYTTASGHQHAVWFESAPSSRAKFEAAREAGIAGVYLPGAGVEPLWGHRKYDPIFKAAEAADLETAAAEHRLP